MAINTDCIYINSNENSKIIIEERLKKGFKKLLIIMFYLTN